MLSFLTHLKLAPFPSLQFSFLDFFLPPPKRGTVDKCGGLLDTARVREWGRGRAYAKTGSWGMKEVGSEGWAAAGRGPCIQDTPTSGRWHNATNPQGGPWISAPTGFLCNYGSWLKYCQQLFRCFLVFQFSQVYWPDEQNVSSICSMPGTLIFQKHIKFSAL